MGFDTLKVYSLLKHVVLMNMFGLLNLLVFVKGGVVPAVIAFGDSILDTGNNNNLLTGSKCNFPPYGRDLPGGIPTGRFCNGKVFSDLTAEGLGVKGLLPPYLDPTLQPGELPTGVCFASGGSGLDPITARIQNVISISDQLNMFKQYMSRLEGVVGQQQANSIISNSLFLISSGNNDLGITYFDAHLKPLDPNTYTSQLVSAASIFVQDLYALGARKIAFMSTLPLGCLPGARLAAGGLFCAEYANQVAQMFNSKLSNELGALNNRLSGAKIFYVDVYSPLLNLIQNPQTLGFLDVSTGCLSGMVPCLNPSTHVFWDFAHPTERAYRIIVNQTLQTYAGSLS